MNLDSYNHSVFSLFYHLVLVINYRRQVLDDAVSDRPKEIFAYIGPSYHIALQHMYMIAIMYMCCSKPIRTRKLPSFLMPTKARPPG